MGCLEGRRSAVRGREIAKQAVDAALMPTQRRDLRSAEPRGLPIGTPLDADVRAQMERAFGTSFAEVRVHADRAAELYAGMQTAHAFASGSEVVFRAGAYRPDTVAGRMTIAHELAHVVQQRRGGHTAGGPAAEADAEQAAAAAGIGLPATVRTGSAVGIARQAKGASPAVPVVQMYEFVDENGAKKQVTAEEMGPLREQAAGRLRGKLAGVKGMAETHRDTHQSFMATIHKQPESTWEAIKDPSSWVPIAVNIRAGVVPPMVSMWAQAIRAAERGQQALAAGNLREAAVDLRLADAYARDSVAEWNRYMDAIQEGGQKLVHELEVVRDVSFAIAITAAVVVAAPVVAGAVGTAGLTGVTGTVATGVGTGLVGAAGGGVLRGGADVVAQKVATGKVNTAQAWKETKRGLKEGGVAGLTAGVAPGIGRAVGVGAEGTSFVSQVARRAVAEGSSQAIGQMTEATLEGKSAKDVLKSGAAGFGTGVVSAPLGAATSRLAASGRPFLSKAVETGGSGVIAGGLTLASGGTTDEAIQNAAIAMASTGSMSAAAPHPPPGPSKKPVPGARMLAAAMKGTADAVPVLGHGAARGPAFLEPPAIVAPAVRPATPTPAAPFSPEHAPEHVTRAPAAPEAAAPAPTPAAPAPEHQTAPAQTAPRPAVAHPEQASQPPATHVEAAHTNAPTTGGTSPEAAPKPPTTKPVLPKMNTRLRGRLNKITGLLEQHGLSWNNAGFRDPQELARFIGTHADDAGMAALEARVNRAIDVRGTQASEISRGTPRRTAQLDPHSPEGRAVTRGKGPELPEQSRLPQETKPAAGDKYGETTGGAWSGTPGHSEWQSDDPRVLSITKGTPIEFTNGKVNLEPWAQAKAHIKVTGNHEVDVSRANAALARQKGWLRKEGGRMVPNAAAADRYMKSEGLTWHHVPGAQEGKMLAVPTALHANVPHIGSASEARAAGGH